MNNIQGGQNFIASLMAGQKPTHFLRDGLLSAGLGVGINWWLRKNGKPGLTDRAWFTTFFYTVFFVVRLLLVPLLILWPGTYAWGIPFLIVVLILWGLFEFILFRAYRKWHKRVTRRQEAKSS